MSDPSATRGGIALLVIDMQRALFAKATPIYRAEQLLANIGALVARARAGGAPVFYVQHADKRDLAEGSDGWQLHPALQPLPGDGRIVKRHGSAFEVTTLAEELQVRGVTRVVVAGLVTHGCVKAACQGALSLGYGVTLVADGHSSYSQKAAELIEEWNGKLAAAGAEVRPSAEISFA
ncbi:MAG TPA: cysteine hydrolase family protein [Anaerolineae bacterium]|nr:cysteine hydrolase family protein [Anaerolineae bacterium]HOQ99602.1 cysteine hydrolase family protein [Anaerolineae bacterium]HPL30511.1 cysteine hydrolase family protein [Anaerolineae bacterium]